MSELRSETPFPVDPELVEIMRPKLDITPPSTTTMDRHHPYSVRRNLGGTAICLAGLGAVVAPLFAVGYFSGNEFFTGAALTITVVGLLPIAWADFGQ